VAILFWDDGLLAEVNGPIVMLTIVELFHIMNFFRGSRVVLCVLCFAFFAEDKLTVILAVIFDLVDNQCFLRQLVEYHIVQGAVAYQVGMLQVLCASYA